MEYPSLLLPVFGRFNINFYPAVSGSWWVNKDDLHGSTPACLTCCVGVPHRVRSVEFCLQSTLMEAGVKTYSYETHVEVDGPCDILYLLMHGLAHRKGLLDPPHPRRIKLKTSFFAILYPTYTASVE